MMVIAISALTIPAGKSIEDTFDITFTTSVVITTGSVTLKQNGKAIHSIPVMPNGTSNTARIHAGSVKDGTYDVEVHVTDGIDFGADTGSSLIIEDTTRPYTAFIIALRTTLEASALLDGVDDKDIIVDMMEHRARATSNAPLAPTIVIQRGSYFPMRRSVARKRWQMEAAIFIETTANWRGQRDDPDRLVVEELADFAQRALEANGRLGGLLIKDIDIIEVSPAVPFNQNDSNFYHVLSVSGWRRELVC